MEAEPEADLIEADTEDLVQEEPQIMEAEPEADLIEADTEVLVQEEPQILEAEAEEDLVEADTENLIEEEPQILQSENDVLEPIDETLVKDHLDNLLDIDDEVDEINTETTDSPHSSSTEEVSTQNQEFDFMDFLSSEGGVAIDSESEDEPEADVLVEPKPLDIAQAVAETSPVCPEPVIAIKSAEDDTPEPEPENNQEIDFMDFL